MRLFVLSSTPLRLVADRVEAGDAVAWFRLGQDVHGEWRRKLEEKGATLIDAELLVSTEEGHRIEAECRLKINEWYKENGRSVTMGPGGIDLAPYISAEIVRSNNIFYLVKAALMFRRLLDRFEGCSEILTDVVNGEYIYIHHRRDPDVLPWREVLRDYAAARAIPITDLESDVRLPGFSREPHAIKSLVMLRNLLSGLRPKLVLSRWRLRLGKPGMPRVFVFNGRDRSDMVTRLAESASFETVVDHHPNPGIARHSPAYTFPALSPHVFISGWRVWRRTRELFGNGRSAPPLTFGDVDIGKYFGRIVRNKVRANLLRYMFVAAQVLRWVRDVRPTAVVVSAECTLDVMVLMDLSRRIGFKVYFVNHSYDFGPILHCSSALADPDMIYVAESPSQAPIYGYWHADRDKFHIPVVTTTQMMAMRRIKGRHRPTTRRVLATNYSSLSPHSVTRTQIYDEYCLCLVKLADVLKERGFELVYRPHPAEDKGSMLHAIEREWRGGESLTIDESPDFATALLAADMHVSGISTCYYQGLYAGWPTVLLDPGFARAVYIGLPADEETGRPVATTFEELRNLVLEALDPSSAVAAFPAAFNGPYAHRYMGSDPDKADEALANFLATEVVGERQEATRPA